MPDHTPAYLRARSARRLRLALTLNATALLLATLALVLLAR